MQEVNNTVNHRLAQSRIPGVLFASLFLLVALAQGNDGESGWQNPADRYADAHLAYRDAACPLADRGIRHFVYFARDRERLRGHPLLTHDRLVGAQVMYLWAELEPQRGRYDFSAIEADLVLLESHGKRLFLQLQDATFFDRYQPAPAYLLDSEFSGGSVRQVTDEGASEGWVVKRWNPAVHARFVALLEALGARFDGRLEGVNLQETAIGVTAERVPDFTPAAYAGSVRERMTALKRAFPTSVTLQYANFMPGEWLPWEDEGYLEGIYRHGQAIGVGLGAPDLMVTRRGQLNHALAMMHELDLTVPLGIAVQDGNYVGVTGREVADDGARANLVPQLHAFADHFLGVDYLFWVDQPPYFKEDLLPCL